MKKIKETLQKKRKQLEVLEKRAAKSLKKAPEGSLVLSKSNGSVQYYHKQESFQKKGQYISAKNRKLVSER